MANERLVKKMSSSSDGSRTTATWSFWVRRITLGGNQPNYFIEHRNSESNGVTNRWAIRLNADHLEFIANTGFWMSSVQYFRDCTNWYHFVIAVNTNATGTNNKFKVWVNGTQLDLTGMATQANTSGNAGFGKGDEEIAIGYSLVDSVGAKPFNMVQFAYVNNQQMQATDFGGYDSDGRWKPKSQTAIRTTVNSGGGFGVNGFLLPLEMELEQQGVVNNGSCPYYDNVNENIYRAIWDNSTVTGNARQEYARVQPSPWTKYSGSALYAPGTFGESSSDASIGINRWTSKNGLFQGGSKQLDDLSNASSWTIEAWVRQTSRLSTNAQGSGVWLGINSSSGSNLVLLRSKNGNSNGWDAWIGGSTNNFITSGTHSAWNYDWQHQAVVWDGTKFKYYSDGKYIGEFTAGNVINSGSYFTLFNELDASTPNLGMDNHCCGMALDSLRITSGQALYTTSTTTVGDTVFTPGDITSKTTFTTDGDTSTSSITGTVTHLLSLPATLAAEIVKDQATVNNAGDSNFNPHWIRVGSNAYPNLTGDAKFGRSSINFTETLDSSSTVHYNAALVEDRLGDSNGSGLNTKRCQFKDVFNGNGDFTIEFWYKVYSVAGRGNYYPRIFDLGGGNTENTLQIILGVQASDVAAYGVPAGVPWLFDNSGNYDWNYSGIDSGPSYTTPNGGSSVCADGKWHHYALTRSGNVFRQFFDGSLYLQRTTSTPAYQTVGYRPAMIGGVSDVAAHTSNNGLDVIDGRFQGAINQFRIVASQALYTSNFTPGDLNSKTTFSTDGTSQGNSITGSVRTLLAPDHKVTGTDVSTSDTVSTNGFDERGFNTGERNIKDNPLNVFCSMTDNDATNTRKNASISYRKVSGMSQSAKEAFTGSMSVSGGKWYFELVQHINGDWLATNGGLAVGWRTTETKADGTEDLGQDAPWGGYSTSFGMRTGQSGSNSDRFLINGNQAFNTAGGKGSDDIATTRGQIQSNGSKIGNTEALVALGVACDLDNGVITYYVNGEQTFTRTDSSIGRGTPSTRWAPAILLETASSSHQLFIANFGDSGGIHDQRSTHFADDNGYGRFVTKPPTGYLALCTENIKTSHNAITDGSQHMKCINIDTTGSSMDIDVGFTPALIMVKRRASNTFYPFTFDRLRGTSSATYGTLRTTTTGQASSSSYMTDYLSTSDGDAVNGFTLGGLNQVNNSNDETIAWCWRADDTFTPTGSSISNATGRRNTTAGFSMMKWDGASGGGHITHGLNRAPDFVIYKNIAATNNWDIYHISVDGPQKSAGDLCNGLIFTPATPRSNSVKAPSSTQLMLVDAYTNGANKVMVAYCWHAVAGYSAFGRYTCASTENQDSNGAPDVNGPFIYCGFKPAFVLMKRVDTDNDWGIRDNARDTENPRTKVLRWNIQGTEGTAGALEEQDQAAYGINFYAEGFQIVSGAGETMANNGEYIYAAWAERPAWAANAVV